MAVRMGIAVAAVLVATSLGGCMDWLDGRPDIPVSRTDLDDSNAAGYITQSRFSVVVQTAEGAEVEIQAKSSSDGLEARGHSDADTPVFIDLPDGTWDITYHVDGHKWETFRDVRIDATPPDAAGIDAFGSAQDGSYTIGEGYSRETGVTVHVRDASGDVVADRLPATVTGLDDGVHGFLVVLEDAAGNRISVNVAVTAGDAAQLPQGQYTFGITARYQNEARLWDISDMDAYLSPADAADAVNGQWLGEGFGITPDHPDVQEIAAAEVSVGDTTMEAAWNLYRWMFDNLEYDEARLTSNTLMLPHQVINDGEDPDGEEQAGEDGDDDGLADDGLGNGVHGGVCRDLAGTYVSLLRAAGVPARLVSGYLAGNVNGFHAWVEVYVGDRPGNPGPWLPVDVSPIDGQWEEPDDGAVAHGVSVSMQSFGIQLPNYLALRTIPESAEVAGWSTALGTNFRYPSGGDPPEVSFEKDPRDEVASEGILCFHKDTHERLLGTSASQCGQGWFVIGRDRDDPQFRDRDPFIIATQRVIDYGVQVTSAPEGSEITIELSYPFEDATHPDDSVSWSPYENRPSGYKLDQGSPDANSGTITAVLES